MKRRLFGIPVALAVTAALATACSSAPGTPASSSGVELHNLTIAVVPAADSAGVYIAQQDGLFAAEGLHVKIEPAISSATVIGQQLAGKFDVTGGNYVSYIAANAEQHADFEILDAGSIMQPHVQWLMISPGSTIRTVSQLRGKTIALNVTGGIAQLLVSALLNANMLSASDVHFAKINFPDMAAALKQHKVAAAFMPEPFATGAERASERSRSPTSTRAPSRRSRSPDTSSLKRGCRSTRRPPRPSARRWRRPSGSPTPTPARSRRPWCAIPPV